MHLQSGSTRLNSAGGAVTFSALTVVLLLLSGCPSQHTGGGKGAAVPGPRLRPQVTKGDPLSLVDRKASVPGDIEVKHGFASLTWSQAVLLSEETDRPMLVYVFTPWCGPCKELDKKTFNQPAFEQGIQHMVAIKIDASTDQGQEVATAFGIHSYPTMVICEPGGKEIERFYGFHPVDEFIQTINDYLAHRKTASWFKEQAEDNPDDLMMQYQAGRELALRHRAEEAEPFLKKVAAQPNNTVVLSGKIPEAMLLLGKTVYAEDMARPDLAIPVLEELAERYPTTYHGVEALYTIAEIYLAAKDTENAAKILQERISVPDHDPISAHRFAMFCAQHNILMDEAVARLEHAIELHPGATYLLKALADIHFRAKRYDQAIEVMTRALEKDPANEAYKKSLDTFIKIRDQQRNK